MSIKIYEGGYISAPLAETLPILKELKTRCSKYADEILRDAACEIAIEMAINQEVGPDTQRSHLLCKNIFPPTMEEQLRTNGIMKACIAARNWARYNKMEVQLIRIRHDCWIDMSVLLFPNKSDQERTYFIAFGSKKMIEFLWQQTDLVQRFFYWNNVDRDEKVTAEEWAHRKTIWEELLVHSTFADNGFNYEICDDNTTDFFMVEDKDLDAYIAKTLPSRLRRMTIDHCVNRELLKRQRDGEEFTFSDMSELMRKYKEKYEAGELEVDEQIVSIFVPKTAKRLKEIIGT